MKSLLAILLFVTAAASADQPIAPVVYVPSAGNDFPRAATNGDTMFVVWRVFASGLIEGACLRHDGTLLQAPAILIGKDANRNGVTPSVVLWIGGHYLVLWPNSSGKMLARRFLSDGSPIDAVSRPTNVPVPQNVVSDGTNAMVVSNTIDGIAVQRIDADGQPIGSPVQISSTGALETAGANSKGVVILRNTWGVYDSLWLGWDGAIRAVTPIPGSWVYGSLTAGDDHFLLTGGFRNALRLDFNGAPIGQLSIIDDPSRLAVLRAAWNGTSWCVVGSAIGSDDYGAVRAARITADGRIDVSIAYPNFHGIGVNDLLWNGTSFVAFGGVWKGVTASFFDTVEASAQSARNVPVSLAAPEELDAMIASTANRSLAVWRVRIDASTFALRGAFITDGVPSAPFELAPEVEDEAPAVATDGTDFFVAWRYGWSIRARIVSAQQVLGPVQQLDGWSSGAVGVTWSGRAWVMAYVDTMVHVAAFQRSGTLAVAPFVVTNPTYVTPVSSFVSLSCDDSDCLLVTRLVEYVPGIGEIPPPNTGTFATRVSRDGARADPLVRIAMKSVSGWPLAMRVNGASVIISSEDGKSLSAVRLDVPGTTTRLVSRTTPLRAVSVDRNGLYWYETQGDGSTLLHWSRVAAQQLPAITSTTDLGGAIPTPVAASSTSMQSHVLFSDGATDPDLLAARLFIRTFASPDPLPPPRRRAK